MSDLKCPFCGGTVDIRTVDMYGNPDTNGTEFALFHEEINLANFCPIATYSGVALGCVNYASAEEAAEAWMYMNEA